MSYRRYSRFDASEVIAATVLAIWFIGMPLSSGHFYKGVCSSVAISGSDLVGQPTCTLMASVFWPFVLPVEFSFWLF